MSLHGDEERQGYYLFEFETTLAVRNPITNDFRLFKKIPVETTEEIAKPEAEAMITGY
jgi:hypothetical protein